MPVTYILFYMTIYIVNNKKRDILFLTITLAYLNLFFIAFTSF